MDKKRIASNFSRNAASYEDHAAVQKKCAIKLMDIIRGKRFSHILEVGCGPGVLTGLLRDEYPGSEITAIDIAENMVDVARNKMDGTGVRFEVSDGEKISMDEKPDLIASNASFQWFEDTTGAMRRFSEILAVGGALCFSMYGPETFRELKEVLKIHFGQDVRLSSSGFISKEALENILKKYFGTYILWEGHFGANFDSLWDFLQDIKLSGARGEGIVGNAFLGKNSIKELEKTYIEKFGRIIATHHVYFCKAEIPFGTVI